MIPKNRSLANHTYFHRSILFSTLLSIFLIAVLLVFPYPKGHCSQVTLTWDPNTEPDLAGYDVYYGTASGNYQWKADVGNVTTYTQSGLNIGATYYFAATAYNTQGLSSGFSNEVVYSVPSCTFIISPSSASFAASGGSGSVLVTSQAGCNWGTSTAPSWITVNPGSGIGSGTMSYTVSPNTGTTRIASLTVAGSVFTVTEAGLPSYTITASAATGGVISPSGGVSVQSGTNQTFTIAANSGYNIAGVTVDGVSQGAIASYTFSAVSANHTISATFAAIPSYTLSISTAGTGSGSVSVNPPGTSFLAGTPVTLTAVPNANSVFSGWSGACSGSTTTCQVAMNSNLSATATFNIKTYTITASAGTGGTISPSGGVIVQSGTSQTFTFIPNTGYSVFGVTVDGVSVGAVMSYTFTNVTASHTIAATFLANTYTITPSAGTGGTISPSSASVTSGGSQIFTITPNSGYSVSGVTIDGVSVGEVSSYTFNNVTANHTISASFSISSGENSTVLLLPTSDTYININSENNSTSDQLNSYTWPAGSVANAILMKFDLSSIPEGATIESAKLNLYLMESDANTSYTAYNLSLHRIINFNPDLSLATGYTYDGTNSWTANTNAYNNIPLAQADITAAYDTQAVSQTAGEKTWDATQLIKDWYAAPATNYGLMINSDPLAPSDTHRTFASSKNATTNYRPFLTVVYSTAAASHTITASAGTGGSISPSGAVSVQSGATQTFAITPNSGYILSGVLVDGVSQGAIASYTFSAVSANHTISATFAAIPSYTLSISTAGTGSGSVSVNPPGTSFLAGTQVTLTANPNANSVFSSWSGACSGTTTTCQVTMSSNVSVTATFNLKTYTITASAGTGGSISPAGGVNVQSGANQLFTITPNSGYNISSVLVDGVSQGAIASYTFSAVSANHTISATFTATPSYTLSISNAGTGSGSVSVNPPGTSFLAGTPVTLTAVPNANSVFSGWSGGCSGTTTTCQVTMNANVTVTATFNIKTYAITASAGTGGSISPSGGVSVQSGANQTFTIAANSGYNIAGVTVDGVSQGTIASYTFSAVSANHTISATFTATPSYTLSISNAGTGSGSVSVNPPGTSFLAGTPVTLTAVPNANSVFSGWSGGCSGMSTTCQVTMDANVSVTATFSLSTGINPPMVVTGSATLVPWSSATLNGTVNPNGLSTTYVFQWGRTTSYGNNTAVSSAGSVTSNMAVSAGITRLSSYTTYHYRLVATNSAGTTYGSDMIFKTKFTGIRK